MFSKNTKSSKTLCRSRSGRFRDAPAADTSMRSSRKNRTSWATRKTTTAHFGTKIGGILEAFDNSTHFATLSELFRPAASLHLLSFIPFCGLSQQGSHSLSKQRVVEATDDRDNRTKTATQRLSNILGRPSRSRLRHTRLRQRFPRWTERGLFSSCSRRFSTS